MRLSVVLLFLKYIQRIIVASSGIIKTQTMSLSVIGTSQNP